MNHGDPAALPGPLACGMPTTAAFTRCGGCGRPDLRTEATAVRCGACDWCFFTNVAAAAAVFLELPPAVPDGAIRLLLVRRSRAPGLGLLGIPGGFVDPGESAETAARRELREELRLELPPAPLRYLCTVPNIYPYRGVNYHTLDTVFTASIAAPPAWFDADEIGALAPTDPFAVTDAELAFPATRAAVAAWREDAKNRGLSAKNR